jgi:hypothetical protein
MTHSFKSLWCLPALLLIFGITGCSKNGSDASTSNNNPVNVSAGTWTINSYTQRGENKTSLFTGYVFSFGSNNVLTATNNGAATTGSWSYTAATSGGGYYGGTPTDATYTFNLGANAPLNRLNRTWNVSSASATNIALTNPEPADDEHVSFVKQ